MLQCTPESPEYERLFLLPLCYSATLVIDCLGYTASPTFRAQPSKRPAQNELLKTKRRTLDTNAVCTRLVKNGLDTLLVDRFDRLGRYTQCYPTILFRNEKSFLLKIHLEASPRLVIGVGDMVTRHRALSGKLILA